ncbi:Beta-lactamase hydrolase-like protein [Tolypocladium ophioglossoides CBS 100239]|uniref:Beta-lactamase hydrolase-like protein n=1 Tax=Tolypocladium ophioglossoides (strain CBS 100239) TaxID=1163406 RepID=A0A0L0MXW0_TOLOC|nr:Beta-lactamase hydrolase-like protein [Tolypocladium ophioglossoides CBS 100239]
MKRIRCHLCSSSQVTQGLLPTPTTALRGHGRQLCSSSLHQQARNTAAHTTGTCFSQNSALYKATLHQQVVRRCASSPRSQGATIDGALFSTKATMAGEPIVHSLFESKTGTWQYVVADPSTLATVIIDPVLDYDQATRAVATRTADSLLSLVKQKGFRVDMILETHAHADHLTAASYLRHRLAREQGHRPSIGIGMHIGQVQKLFGQRYGISDDEYEGVFDKLFDDDESFNIGNLRAMAMHLPGHTPDHLGYKIGDNVFCGDSLFHVDIGTARCDFPGGSAHNLFASGRKLLGLPDHVKLWPGHDYPPEGRGAPVPWMSVQDHKAQNTHLNDGVSEEEFVALRQARDANLAAPRLLHESLQMNIRAGRLPRLTASGQRMLYLPLKLQGVEW